MNEDIDQVQRPARSSRKRTTALAAAVGVVGLVVGGLTGGAISAASADSGGSGETASQVDSQPAEQSGGQERDEVRGPHGGGEPLTGTAKDKVEAAVEAEYPDATIHRVETDPDGAYEAHIVDDEKPLVVELDEDFEITGTDTPRGPGGCEGHGGPGRGDPDGSDGRGGPDGPEGSESPEGSAKSPSA